MAYAERRERQKGVRYRGIWRARTTRAAMDVLRWILYRPESCRPSLRGPGDLGRLVGNRPDRNQSIISSGPCTIATIPVLC